MGQANLVRERRGTFSAASRCPAVERRADSGRAIGDWAEITFDDPRPDEEDDQFRFHLLSADRAEMLYVGTGLPVFTLERVGAGALLGPFVEGKVYGGARSTGTRRAPARARRAAAALARRRASHAAAGQPRRHRRSPPARDAPVQGRPR
jgi:hypothetical protein